MPSMKDLFGRKSKQNSISINPSSPTPPSEPIPPLADVDEAQILSLIPPSQSSRFKRGTLRYILADSSGAAPYFRWYLESKDADSLHRFWLDVEQYRSLSLETTSDVLDSTFLGQTRRHCQEFAAQINRDYLEADCPHPLIGLPDNNKTTSLSHLNPNMFDEAQILVEEILDSRYLNEFFRSKYYARHRVNIFAHIDAGGTVALDDILADDTLLSLLTEFMSTDGGSRSILIAFWMVTSNTLCSGHDRFQIQRDALAIYDRFVSPQAVQLLGVPEKIRHRLEERIFGEDGASAECYDELRNLVAWVIEQNHLPAFFESVQFRKHADSLQALVATANIGCNRQHSGSVTSLSTCSSSYAADNPASGRISCQNTLLASGGLASSIQSCRTNVGHCLWKRRGRRHRVTQANIGQIDNLGRYSSQFEIVPGLHSKARRKINLNGLDISNSTTGNNPLTRVVRRFVTKDGQTMDGVQEEMAWRMAEMIVKDVQETNKAGIEDFYEQEIPFSENIVS